MDLTPVIRFAVSDTVFARLVEEILSGRLAPGEALPGERDLAESFQVNRHAVREALKRVQQAGLIRISQGDKTRVLDWRTNAGLDVLSALAAAGAVPPLRIMHDIAQMRRVIAADASRLCALNASDQELAAVTAAAEAYPSDPAGSAVFDADLAFWGAVIAGCGNVAYQLGLNTIVGAYAEIGWQVISDLGMAVEYADRDAHLQLARLIADGDAKGAHRLTEDLLGHVVAVLAAAEKE